MSVSDNLCALVESRLPLTVESDGNESDWHVVGPAILAAVAQHMRTIADLQAMRPSRVTGWQLLRSMLEYVATYAWVAASSDDRTKQWLKYDYEQRRKLDSDLRELGEPSLPDEDRRRVDGFLPEIEPMPNLVERANGADDHWDRQLRDLNDALGGKWPEEFSSFRLVYPLIYRNGSRFTHPSSHVVDAFVSGDAPRIVIGPEKPPERDLVVVATGVFVVGLTVAVSGTPTLGLALDDVVGALAAS